MKKNQTDFINTLGIGAFTFLSINEFSVFIAFVLEIVLVITKTDSKLIQWLPDLINLVIFSMILIWIINKHYRPTKIDTRKTLIKSIAILFGIFLLHILFSFLKFGFLVVQYSTEFNLYYESLKGNYNLQGYTVFIPILKYLIFAIILLIKRKTVANIV